MWIPSRQPCYMLGSSVPYWKLLIARRKTYVLFFQKKKAHRNTSGSFDRWRKPRGRSAYCNLESQLQAETDIDEQAKLYEALGLAQAKLSRTEEAIDALEKACRRKIDRGRLKTDVPLHAQLPPPHETATMQRSTITWTNGRNAANRQTTYDQRQLN